MQLSADIHNILSDDKIEPEQRILTWKFNVDQASKPKLLTEDELEQQLNDAYEAHWRSIVNALKQQSNS